MANIIKIKRKPLANGAGVPSSLVAGELAFSEADARLYYGLDSAGSVSPIEIAGSGYVVTQITNYAPSKAGTGATGTWNISVTGNAGTVTSGVYTSRSLTAGSGLAGGGDLSTNRTFDVGQGDGITVGADTVSVDTTVVRTSGTQTVNGLKTFGNQIVFGSGISASGINNIQAAATASTATQFAVFTSSPNSSAQTILTRTPTEVKTDIGLSNVTNDAQVKKIASTTIGYVPTWSVTSGDQLGTGYSVETTLVGASTSLPRSDAVKTYIDNAIVSGIATNGAMIFKGVIDCSSNPNYPAADRGWTYKVSVAGKIGGASGPTVEVNDTMICTTDGTASGDHATVGSNWVILQTNITDSSILVTGPTSAVSGNFALFNGTTGKIIADSSYNATSFASSGHVHGNITNAGAIGSTANLPIITTTNGVLTTGSFGTTANTFCQGNDSRLSDTRNTTNALTMNNSGAGDASGSTFNGSAAKTISYNSIGAPSTTGANATGTWNISISGNAATVTNGVYTSRTISTTSGLTGGGDLSSNRTLSVVAGTGIIVNTDGVHVNNSNFVLTTGAQTINGVKTFGDKPIFGSGIVASGTNSLQVAATASSGTQMLVFISDPSSSAQTVYTRTPTQIKSDLGLNNVENTALSTWAGSTNITTLGTISTGSWNASTIPVNKGGTGQTTYTDGQLLIGNTTGNTLTKSTLTTGSGISIINGAGSITIAHEDTSALNGLQGGNGISSVTVDGFGHITAIGTATYLTSATVCTAIADCTIDGGTFS